ncbi:hypothetical protein DNK47_02630 [Mycoplasma wenyonii]|uniref:Type I restriction modification DNA specificity domain-containing protein n=1 Tax=Mycoplasma wenyonii TaxID=65123 RepID=A0A328PP64_9MOLU|nr:restriction endonuclease subunit S [Mycoplasma wenyonii]RAO94906.1 hypothetical protein DNK47_02630 [Mycoplasma wenyonii]
MVKEREINETLEKWMESYYHILFDKLSEDQLERKKLGDLVTIVGGGTPSTKCPEYWTKEGGIPWIGISDLTANKGKFINKGEINITEEGKRNSSTRLVPVDSILLACVGATIGKTGINYDLLCLSRSLLGIYGKFHKNYYFWFLFNTTKKDFQNLSHRTAIDCISQKDLREFEVNSPMQHLIEEFNQICEPFFQIQKTNEKGIRELLKLQSTLLN